jgi:hypothetical protein
MADQPAEDVEVTLGTDVYDGEGRKLGTVRGFDDHGFHVSTEEGIVGMSIEHVRAGHEYGEAEMMWRCYDCGEFGDLQEGMPEACPACGAAKEELYYYKDD